MRIHYISSFVDTELLDEYRVTPSNAAKVGYVKSALLQAGFELSLFSFACNKNNKVSRSRHIKIDNREIHHYPFCVGGQSLFLRYCSYFLIFLQLFLYLLKIDKKNDVVLLYHSIQETKVVKFFNRLLGLKIVLELEELYSVSQGDDKSTHQEKELIQNGFVGYIVVNSIIGQRCDLLQPLVVCEGQYTMLTNKGKSIASDDGRIHIVYAGIFQDNADVFIAIKVASLLNGNYKMHIAGYGDEATVNKVIAAISRHNLTGEGCELEYHGCLHGEEYENLLSQCSIGLCTRVLEDKLSDYTFPSKVFAYLSRNLKVVCTPISCVKCSPISDRIVFSESISAESVYRAITCVDASEIIDNSSILENQNSRFVHEVISLFSVIAK